MLIIETLGFKTNPSNLQPNFSFYTSSTNYPSNVLLFPPFFCAEVRFLLVFSLCVAPTNISSLLFGRRPTWLKPEAPPPRHKWFSFMRNNMITFDLISFPAVGDLVLFFLSSYRTLPEVDSLTFGNFKNLKIHFTSTTLSKTFFIKSLAETFVTQNHEMSRSEYRGENRGVARVASAT